MTRNQKIVLFLGTGVSFILLMGAVYYSPKEIVTVEPDSILKTETTETIVPICTPSYYDLKYRALLKQHEIWLEAQNNATKELHVYIEMHNDYSSSLYYPIKNE